VNPAGALLSPLDVVRSALYRGAAPWLAPFYGDRERRVAVFGAVSVAVALAVTLVVPLWSLALGPLVFGVPHLVSDLRYLVVRPGFHRRTWLVLLAGAPLVATSFGAGPAVGLASVVVAVLFARGAWTTKTLMLVPSAALVGVALWQPVGFQLVFLHLHNAVALLVWWLWRKRGAVSLLVPAAVLGGTALLLSGAAEPVLSMSGGWNAPWTQTSFADFVETTTPLANPVWAARLVLLFCFLQQVHYGAWLRMIPDDDRARPAPRTFRATWTALVQDFGLAPLLVAVALALGLAAWGLVSLRDARLGYLYLAAFHGYLELAAGALLLVERRRA
jgi:hypothetical protein